MLIHQSFNMGDKQIILHSTKRAKYLLDTGESKYQIHSVKALTSCINAELPENETPWTSSMTYRELDLSDDKKRLPKLGMRVTRI